MNPFLPARKSSPSVDHADSTSATSSSSSEGSPSPSPSSEEEEEGALRRGGRPNLIPPALRAVVARADSTEIDLDASSSSCSSGETATYYNGSEGSGEEEEGEEGEEGRRQRPDSTSTCRGCGETECRTSTHFCRFYSSRPCWCECRIDDVCLHACPCPTYAGCFAPGT